jgi:predicted alpha/beta superfamily hydrolase
MKPFIVFCLLFVVVIDNINAQDQKVSLDQTYSKWYESKIVGDKFLIQCYIPNQKAIPTDSLPIIFLLDSDMSFGLAYDIVGWLRWSREIPYVAIVGISYGTGQNDWWKKRSRDYSFSKDQKKVWGDWPLAGGSANFIKFLETELFQFIADEYCLKGNDRTIVGLSLGGLLCTEILFSKPELFDKYIILGPALIWNDKEIFKIESQYYKNHSTLKANVFTAVGSLDQKEIIEPWTEFVDIIRERNYSGLVFKSWVIENETHISMFPAGLTRGLRTTLNRK